MNEHDQLKRRLSNYADGDSLPRQVAGEALRVIEAQDEALQQIAAVVGVVAVVDCPCPYCKIVNTLRAVGVIRPPETGPTLFDSFVAVADGL